MTVVESAAAPTIALIGNPNTGKSTLFSALAGVRQRVGNYPGVTVEKKLGRMTHGGRTYTLIDLPGTYSLAPRSPDEMVAVDLLLGRLDEGAPDAVLSIIDASNLERNLYLVSQVLELGLPTVVALNMTDVAEARGITIDVAELSKRIGAPVVAIQAHHSVGLDALRSALGEACAASVVSTPVDVFPPQFDAEVAGFAATYANLTASEAPPRYLLRRLLLDTSGYLQGRLFPTGDKSGEGTTEANGSLAEAVAQSRERLKAAGLPVPAVEAMSRYAWVGRVVDGAVRRAESRPDTLTDRIDRVVTHRWWGTLIFTALMVVVFQAVFQWAAPLMDLIDAGVGYVSEWTASVVPPGALQSLLVQGVIGGVGGVIIFLPQILVLFLFIGILEDCGYMARAAYLMDRLMVRVGLSGKSFIPLLSSFACAIPGIMATRVIENRRDRLTTILIAPLMSCSARLPVYVLLIAAFVPQRDYAGGLLGLHGLVMFGMYLVGIVAAVIVALLLKKTLLRGPTPPFVLELPSYKMPSPRTVIFRIVDRGWAFLKNAGTLIVAVSIVVWALLYFPRDEEAVEGPHRERVAQLTQSIEARRDATEEPAVAVRTAAEEQLAEIERHIEGEYKRASYLGSMGHAIEPIVEPLGWDWRIGSAAIASFPAREVVVATLGILFDVGDEVDDEEGSSRLQQALTDAKHPGTDRPLFTLATALSLMVFFALCAQCAATLAIIRRETNSWRWPLFTFCYMTGLAYVAAWATYQIASRFA
jgi:ferrous iron transport protein B